MLLYYYCNGRKSTNSYALETKTFTVKKKPTVQDYRSRVRVYVRLSERCRFVMQFSILWFLISTITCFLFTLNDSLENSKTSWVVRLMRTLPYYVMTNIFSENMRRNVNYYYYYVVTNDDNIFLGRGTAEYFAIMARTVICVYHRTYIYYTYRYIRSVRKSTLSTLCYISQRKTCNRARSILHFFCTPNRFFMTY